MRYLQRLIKASSSSSSQTKQFYSFIKSMVSMSTINRSLNMQKLIFAVLLLFACSTAQQLSSKECEDLGFTGLALCSDCNALADYVKDQELLSDCRKCCIEDSDDSTSKIIYSGAVLEVCMRKLVFYPEIVSFIEDEKEKFPSVKVQYSFNAPPKLIMLDDAGQHKETIRIDNWKREHMLEFLKEKLKLISSI